MSPHGVLLIDRGMRGDTPLLLPAWRDARLSWPRESGEADVAALDSFVRVAGGDERFGFTVDYLAELTLQKLEFVRYLVRPQRCAAVTSDAADNGAGSLSPRRSRRPLSTWPCGPATCPG
jgi:hypothetical protein